MLRLGLICDFVEDGWPSMDLVGDMLFEHLHRWHSDTIHTDQIRPAFRRRVTAPHVLRSSHVAWNSDRLWNRMVDYPRLLRKLAHNYDLFHIVDHSYSHLALVLPPERTVITCHDLDTFRCLLEPAREPRPLWFREMTRRILKGFQSARHVIFVSESVRQEADRLGLISRSRSSVAHNGADHEIRRSQIADREIDDVLDSKAGEFLLLSVGSTIPRKRMDVLLRTFAEVVKELPNVRLVRVGGQLTETQSDLARQLGISRSIVELPFLKPDVLSALYRRATLLLQPSDAEGFGLPVVEAMARGCPVAASDLASLRETGGQAAIYCPAGDVAEWTRTVIHLLRQSRDEPVAWSDLCKRSSENAGRFKWRETVARVVSVYQEVVESADVSRSLSLFSASLAPSRDEMDTKLREQFVVFGHGK